MSPTPAEQLLVRLLAGHAAQLEDPAWAQAFTACTEGRFSDALALAQRCLTSLEGHEAAQLLMSAGSALRQIGHHRLAGSLESRAPSCCSAHTAHMAASAVANAVGLQDLALAQSLLVQLDELIRGGTAGPETAMIGDSRIRIRRAWVAAEVALMASQPRAARDHLRPAEDLLEERDWPKHRAKTHLFVAVAEQVAGDTASASQHLTQARREALRVNARAILEVVERSTAAWAT